VKGGLGAPLAVPTAVDQSSHNGHAGSGHTKTQGIPGGDEAVYRYVDDRGTTLYEKVRHRGKRFSQRRPDPKRPDRYLTNLDGVRRVPYRLPEVIEAANHAADVWYVEGEKDADRLSDLGLVATTLGSATSPIPRDFAQRLKGIGRLLVIPDADGPGRRHAAQVAEAAFRAVGEVRIVEICSGDNGADVSDFLDGGKSSEDLWRLAEGAPNWSPPPSSEDTEPRRSAPRPRPADDLMAHVTAMREEERLELFHDDCGDTFATIWEPQTRAARTYPTDSRRFEQFLES